MPKKKGPHRRRRVFGALAPALAASAALLAATPSAAWAQEKPFVYVPVDVPTTGDFAGMQLFHAAGVNNRNDFCGIVKLNGTEPNRAYAVKDGVWHLIGPDNSTGVGIDDDGNVVGYIGGNLAVWIYGSGTKTYSEDPLGLYDATKLGMAINERYDGSGDPDNDQTGDVAGQRNGGAFMELHGGSPADLIDLNVTNPHSAAYGLNDALEIAGFSRGSATDNSLKAVVWPNAVPRNPIVLDRDYSDPNHDFTTTSEYRAHAISNNDLIVGSYRPDDASNYSYCIWRGYGGANPPDAEFLSQPTHTEFNCVAVNDANDFVAKDRLYHIHSTTGALYSKSFADLAAHYPSDLTLSSVRFFSMADTGTLTGVGTRNLGGGVNLKVGFLLVPRNDDGDRISILRPTGEGVTIPLADFRECVNAIPQSGTNPLDADGDWVLDRDFTFRAGLYAVGKAAERKIEEIVYGGQVCRIHLDQFSGRNILLGIEPDPCSDEEGEGFADTINRIGYNHAQNAPQREVLIMHRTQMPAAHPGFDTQYDYVPPKVGDRTLYSNELTQEDILADLECFWSQLALHADYAQVGNEAFAGTGLYYLEAGQIPGYSGWTGGTIQNVPLAYQDAACDVILDWLEKQAETIRRASALAGRPVRIVGPAMLLTELDHARQQSGSTATIETKQVKNVFERSNAFADLVAIHLHHRLDGDIEGKIDPVLDWLVATSGTWLVTEGVRPKRSGCTEWGAYASPLWNQAWATEQAKYYENCPGTPVEPLWNNFINTNWINAPNTISPDFDDKLGIPRILAKMSAAGLVFGCYGGYSTFGSCGVDPNNQFDLSALWASDCVIDDAHIDDETGEDRFVYPVRNLYEGEADTYYDADLGEIHRVALQAIVCP